MKYWVFQNNQVTGPYHPDDLTQVPGYSGETLVCPEGRRGTNMGDWQRASMVPELSLSIIKAGQLAVALKGGGGYGSLPPEPTLKDLAALGSLQEKVSLLDNTVSHLQESLRLKEEELLSVHQDLDDKTKYAQELSVKLGGLEERFTAVNQLREGLDKAVEAEHQTEGLVDKQSKLIEDLSSQLKALRDEQRQMDELRNELAALRQKQEAERQETEKKLAEARQAAEDAAKKAAEAEQHSQEALSRPAAALPSAGQPLGGPSLGAPVAGQPLGGPIGGQPLGGPIGGGLDAPLGGPAPSAAERLGLPSERPGPEITRGFEPSSSGLAPLGDAKPLEPLGGAAPLGAVPAFEPMAAIPPAPMDAPSPIAGAPAAAPSVVPEPAKAEPKSKKSLVLVGVAVVAVVALGAVKLGLVGGKKPAAPVADQTPLPPPPAAPVPAPKTPTPEELAEQEKQTAIDLVKSQPLPGGLIAGGTLERKVPLGAAPPWMADGKAGKYQVNFYVPKTDDKPGQVFEFDVTLADRKVSAHNKLAQALLSGQPLDEEAPKKVAKAGKRGNPRKPKIKPKAQPEGDDTGLLSDLLTGDEDKPAPKKTAKAAAKKAAPAPAEGDGGGDLLIDGSGHDAQPLEAAAKPIRKAPKRAPEKRNVDRELNDLLSDADAKPAPKAAAPKQESLDDLLEPGASAKPGDAAPVAEPSPSAADDTAAAPAPVKAEPPPSDSDLASPDEQAAAQPAKKAGKAPKPAKKSQAADAELLDDLLKP